MSNIDEKKEIIKEPHYYKLINNFEDLTEILISIEDENPEIKEIMQELKNIDTANILESANMLKKMTKVLNFVHNYNTAISAFNICNNVDYANEALKSELKDNSKNIKNELNEKLINKEIQKTDQINEEKQLCKDLIKKNREEILKLKIGANLNKNDLENKIATLENEIKNYQEIIIKNNDILSKKSNFFDKIKKYFNKKDNIDIENELINNKLLIEKEEFSKKINVLKIENENIFKNYKKIIKSEDLIQSAKSNDVVLFHLKNEKEILKKELSFYSNIALECFNKTNKTFEEAYKDHKFEDLKVKNGSESLLNVVNDKIKEMVKKAEYGLLYTTIKGVEFKENEKTHFQKFTAQSNYAIKKFLTELKDPYVAASLVVSSVTVVSGIYASNILPSGTNNMNSLMLLYSAPSINKGVQVALKFFKKDKEVVDATSIGGLDKKTSEEVVKKSVNIINDMFDNFKYSVIKKNPDIIFNQNNNKDSKSKVLKDLEVSII